MRSLSKLIVAGVLVLGFGPLAYAQDEATPEAAPEAAPAAAPEAEVSAADLEAKFAAVEKELDELRKQVEEKESGGSALSGWQLQIRGGWNTLFKNHRDNVFKNDDHQHGWTIGVAFMAPLWKDLGPIDLYGHLAIDYRQVAYSTTFTAPITGEKGTINYLDVTAAPTIRFAINDMLTPYGFAGFMIQVASPPDDAITYLDLGFTLGVGLDIKVHEHVSLGVEYKMAWFGVADQEEEDFGQGTVYLGFNF